MIRKLLTTVIFTLMIVISGSASAASYNNNGIYLELPPGWQFVTPQSNLVMEAQNPYTRANVNMSVEYTNTPDMTLEQLNQGANFLYNKFQQSGVNMVGGNVIHAGNHYAINLFGRRQVNGMTLGHLWRYLMIHNKRYTICYTFNETPNNEFSAILASADTIRCNVHW